VVNVRNPLRDDQSKLRQSLLPGLLRNARDNLNRGAGSVAMFETGRVFFARPWHDDPRVPEQPMRLGVVAAGPFGGAGLGRPQQSADATVAFAVLASVSQQLGTPLERRAAPLPGLHPTRSAEVLLDGRVVGVAGELGPDAASAFEIDGRVAVIELALSEILTPPVPHQMTPLSTFPHVDFDLSFDVPDSVTAVALVAATSAVSTFVESSEVFDEYRPEHAQGRSMAVRYRLRALDRTLGGDDLATVRAAMIEAAGALGAKLRGAATKEGA
jgi:phenylalanyl-tRNA synthetase beta chain